MPLSTFAENAACSSMDADPQGTARWWWGIGAERGRTLPEVVAMDLQDGAQLDRAAAAFDTVIVDCPSRGELVVRSALTVADLVLVPCGTEPLDAAPLRDTLDLIDSARALRPTLAARVVITRRLDDEAPLFSVEMAERLALLDDRILILEPGRAGAVPLLGVELADREAYQVALVEGQGVTNLRGDADAVREFRAFTDAVEPCSWRSSSRLLGPTSLVDAGELVGGRCPAAKGRSRVARLPCRNCAGWQAT